VSNLTEAKLKSGKGKGKVYGRYTVTDSNNEPMNLTVWNEQYLKVKDALEVGRPFKALCAVNEFNGVKGLILISLLPANV
jgi:hypothetical protein